MPSDNEILKIWNRIEIYKFVLIRISFYESFSIRVRSKLYYELTKWLLKQTKKDNKFSDTLLSMFDDMNIEQKSVVYKQFGP